MAEQSPNDLPIEYTVIGRWHRAEAFAPHGMQFAGGHHSLFVEWPHGPKSKVVAALKLDLMLEVLTECEPDCECKE